MSKIYPLLNSNNNKFTISGYSGGSDIYDCFRDFIAVAGNKSIYISEDNGSNFYQLNTLHNISHITFYVKNTITYMLVSYDGKGWEYNFSTKNFSLLVPYSYKDAFFYFGYLIILDHSGIIRLYNADNFNLLLEINDIAKFVYVYEDEGYINIGCIRENFSIAQYDVAGNLTVSKNLYQFTKIFNVNNLSNKSLLIHGEKQFKKGIYSFDLDTDALEESYINNNFQYFNRILRYADIINSTIPDDYIVYDVVSLYVEKFDATNTFEYNDDTIKSNLLLTNLSSEIVNPLIFVEYVDTNLDFEVFTPIITINDAVLNLTNIEVPISSNLLFNELNSTLVNTLIFESIIDTNLIYDNISLTFSKSNSENIISYLENPATTNISLNAMSAILLNTITQESIIDTNLAYNIDLISVSKT